MEPAGSTPFGQRLRQLRLTAGLTQQPLAERSRVSVDAISAYENGRREAFQLERIVDHAQAPCWPPDPLSPGPCHIR
ncbi:MAG TPA: helix-turn-helix transcriptional regulator [Candidatus Dormibacteraeota bacterium]|nr:helix-turn-helix transcriptional regulator [Candidatus Dormibacteraeota bacterium]